jgi:hypothetical protein
VSHDQSTVNPYRKVSTATWSDRKVMNLTPLQPSGQALFLMLMVGPQTTHIPGVQPVGRLAFAEMLGWESEAFDEAFAEAYREGLVKADWKVRLIFVPNAIKHNLPQSPNVVKSWGAMWARIPECDLKVEAWNALHAALEGLGQGFADAFKSACPLKNQDYRKGFGEELGKPTEKATEKATDNQEAGSSKQKEIPPLPPKGGGRRFRKAVEEPEGFARFWTEWPAGKRKEARGMCAGVWGREGLEAMAEQIVQHVVAKRDRTDWAHDGGQYVEAPLVYLNQRKWEGADLAAAPQRKREVVI